MAEHKPVSADYDAHAEDRVLMHHVAVEANVPQSSAVAVVKALAKLTRDTHCQGRPLWQSCGERGLKRDLWCRNCANETRDTTPARG